MSGDHRKRKLLIIKKSSSQTVDITSTQASRQSQPEGGATSESQRHLYPDVKVATATSAHKQASNLQSRKENDGLFDGVSPKRQILSIKQESKDMWPQCNLVPKERLKQDSQHAEGQVKRGRSSTVLAQPLVSYRVSGGCKVTISQAEVTSGGAYDVKEKIKSEARSGTAKDTVRMAPDKNWTSPSKINAKNIIPILDKLRTENGISSTASDAKAVDDTKSQCPQNELKAQILKKKFEKKFAKQSTFHTSCPRTSSPIHMVHDTIGKRKLMLKRKSSHVVQAKKGLLAVAKTNSTSSLVKAGTQPPHPTQPQRKDLGLPFWVSSTDNGDWMVKMKPASPARASTVNKEEPTSNPAASKDEKIAKASEALNSVPSEKVYRKKGLKDEKSSKDTRKRSKQRRSLEPRRSSTGSKHRHSQSVPFEKVEAIGKKYARNRRSKSPIKEKVNADTIRKSNIEKVKTVEDLSSLEPKNSTNHQPHDDNPPVVRKTKINPRKELAEFTQIKRDLMGRENVDDGERSDCIQIKEGKPKVSQQGKRHKTLDPEYAREFHKRKLQKRSGRKRSSLSDSIAECSFVSGADPPSKRERASSISAMKNRSCSTDRYGKRNGKLQDSRNDVCEMSRSSSVSDIFKESRWELHDATLDEKRKTDSGNHLKTLEGCIKKMESYIPNTSAGIKPANSDEKITEHGVSKMTEAADCERSRVTSSINVMKKSCTEKMETESLDSIVTRAYSEDDSNALFVRVDESSRFTERPSTTTKEGTGTDEVITEVCAVSTTVQTVDSLAKVNLRVTESPSQPTSTTLDLDSQQPSAVLEAAKKSVLTEEQITEYLQSIPMPKTGPIQHLILQKVLENMNFDQYFHQTYQGWKKKKMQDRSFEHHYDLKPQQPDITVLPVQGNHQTVKKPSESEANKQIPPASTMSEVISRQSALEALISMSTIEPPRSAVDPIVRPAAPTQPIVVTSVTSSASKKTRTIQASSANKMSTAVVAGTINTSATKPIKTETLAHPSMASTVRPLGSTTTAAVRPIANAVRPLKERTKKKRKPKAAALQSPDQSLCPEAPPQPPATATHDFSYPGSQVFARPLNMFPFDNSSLPANIKVNGQNQIAAVMPSAQESSTVHMLAAGFPPWALVSSPASHAVHPTVVSQQPSDSQRQSLSPYHHGNSSSEGPLNLSASPPPLESQIPVSSNSLTLTTDTRSQQDVREQHCDTSNQGPSQQIEANQNSSSLDGFPRNPSLDDLSTLVEFSSTNHSSRRRNTYGGDHKRKSTQKLAASSTWYPPAVTTATVTTASNTYHWKPLDDAIRPFAHLGSGPEPGPPRPPDKKDSILYKAIKPQARKSDDDDSLQGYQPGPLATNVGSLRRPTNEDVQKLLFKGDIATGGRIRHQNHDRTASPHVVVHPETSVTMATDSPGTGTLGELTPGPHHDTTGRANIPGITALARDGQHTAQVAPWQSDMTQIIQRPSGDLTQIIQQPCGDLTQVIWRPGGGDSQLRDREAEGGVDASRHEDGEARFDPDPARFEQDPARLEAGSLRPEAEAEALRLEADPARLPEDSDPERGGPSPLDLRQHSRILAEQECPVPLAPSPLLTYNAIVNDLQKLLRMVEERDLLLMSKHRQLQERELLIQEKDEIIRQYTSYMMCQDLRLKYLENQLALLQNTG